MAPTAFPGPQLHESIRVPRRTSFDVGYDAKPTPRSSASPEIRAGPWPKQEFMHKKMEPREAAPRS